MVRQISAFSRRAAFSLAFLVAGCATIQAPGPQNVTGMSPVGTVTLNEATAVGAAGGRGTLYFQGRAYPFKLIGGVTGGVGASDIVASGDVYNLRNAADFPGVFAQSSGERGLDTSVTANLWLRNNAGVVMHLKGTQAGGTLSLGRDEIVIEFM